MRGFLTVFFTVALSWVLYAQTSSITFTFNGLTSRTGDVLLSLRNQDGEPVKEVIIPIPSSGPVKYTIENLKNGIYTAACFHDENKNQKLDIGAFGPKEDYGFSNDARGTMGPPDIEDQRFTLRGNLQMTIRIH